MDGLGRTEKWLPGELKMELSAILWWSRRISGMLTRNITDRLNAGNVGDIGQGACHGAIEKFPETDEAGAGTFLER